MHALLISLTLLTTTACYLVQREFLCSAVSEHTHKVVASSYLARTEVDVSVPGKVSGTG